MATFEALVRQNFTAKNWRLTLPVRAIVKLLETSHTLLGAAEIQKELAKIGQKTDISTIYRILEKLSLLSLIHEFEGKWKRCTCPENKSDEHHFLICTECQRVEEIFLDYKEAIAEQLYIEKKFRLEHVHLGFWGYCKDCQK